MSNQPPYDPQGGQPGGQNYPQGQPGYGAPQGQPGYGAPQGQPGHGAPQGGGYPGAPQGGYGSAPQMPGGGMGAPVDAAKPKSIDLAQKLMYAGAGLAVVNAIVTLLTADSIKDKVRDKLGSAASQAELDSTFSSFNTQAIVGAVIGVVLWLLMAKFNGDGKKWARIVATVLFVISTLSLLFNLMAGVATAPILLILVLTWLVGLGAIILLYKPESTQYYNAKSARPV